MAACCSPLRSVAGHLKTLAKTATDAIQNVLITLPCETTAVGVL